MKEIKPTIHLGEKASALERRGIHTDKGDYNREVKYLNSLIVKAQEFKSERIDKLVGGVQKAAKETMQTVRKEVLELIHRTAVKKGVMSAPIVKSKYYAKISNREVLSKPQTAENFIINNGITQKKFDREHEAEIAAFPETEERLLELKGDGKATPKAWAKEIAELEESIPPLKQEYIREVSGLAAAEVIEYTKKDMERIEANESRRRSREQTVNQTTEKPKRMEKEI